MSDLPTININTQLPTSLFDASLADEPHHDKAITLHVAEQLFQYFKNEPLFRWSDANNDCEDRANAICILLDEWGIPNYKGWVFSGYFLKKNYGSLINTWNFHVAALLPVQSKNGVEYFVIDPATLPGLSTIQQWALQITSNESSYHIIKHSEYYIFPAQKLDKHNWHKRNKRNYRWTMQGLSGINGISPKGKAQLAFKKNKVKQTQEKFRKLKNEKPAFLNEIAAIQTNV